MNIMVTPPNIYVMSFSNFFASGPLNPGYKFYDILSHSSHLCVPIPDTVVVDGPRIYHLFNDKNGYIKKAVPNLESREGIEAFIGSVMDRFVYKSVSLWSGNKQSRKEKEHISKRIVGVIKKPAWRTHITNNTETLTALGVQTYLLHGMVAGNTDTYIIQKFVKSKGRKPSYTRVMWKMNADIYGSTGRQVVGWNIFGRNDFTTAPQQEIRNDGGAEQLMRKLGRR